MGSLVPAPPRSATVGLTLAACAAVTLAGCGLPRLVEPRPDYDLPMGYSGTYRFGLVLAGEVPAGPTDREALARLGDRGELPAPVDAGPPPAPALPPAGPFPAPLPIEPAPRPLEPGQGPGGWGDDPSFPPPGRPSQGGGPNIIPAPPPADYSAPTARVRPAEADPAWNGPPGLPNRV